MGYAQIRRVESLIERKREICNQYKLVLKPIESLIKMNPETSLTKNGYWLPTVVVDKLISFDRQAYFNFMSDNDIDSRPFFYPLSTLPMFSTKKSNVVAYSIYNRAVNLPSFHDMTNEQVQYVGEKFIDFFNKNDL
jgi:perosamine synthetase